MAIAKSTEKSFEVKTRTVESGKPKNGFKEPPKTEMPKTDAADRAVFENKTAALKNEAEYQRFRLNRDLRAKGGGDIRAAQFSQVKSVNGVPNGPAIAASEEIRAAQYRVQDAQAEVARIEEQFNDDLVEVGTVLTDDQRETAIREFREQNAATYQELDEAAQALNDSLRTHRSVMVEAAANDFFFAGDLHSALAVNAETGDPQLTLEITNQILARDIQDSRNPFSEYTGQIVFDDIIQPAMTRAAGDALIRSEGNVERAVEAYLAEAGNLASVVDVIDSVGGVEFSFEDYGNYLRDMARATPEEAVRLAGQAEEMGAAGRLFASAGLLFNFSAAANAEGWEKLDYAASGTQAALELLPDVLKAAGRYSDEAARLGVRAGTVAARLTPILGIAANFAALAAHGQDMRNNPNAGLFIAILGDATALIGSYFESFPVTAPLGAPISAVGTLVSIIGEGISDIIRGDEDRQRQQRLLESAGIPAATARTLVNANGERLQELKDLGISNTLIQTLAGRYDGSLFEGSGRGFSLVGVKELAQTFGLSGYDVYNLLTRAGGDGGSDADAVLGMTLHRLTDSANWDSRTNSRQGWLTVLNELSAEYARSARDDARNGAYYRDISEAFARLRNQLNGETNSSR